MSRLATRRRGSGPCGASFKLNHGRITMKIVSFYETAPDALPKLMDHCPEHRARLNRFHARGVLLAAGPLGSPPEGAMGDFYDPGGGRGAHPWRPLRHRRLGEFLAPGRMERPFYLAHSTKAIPGSPRLHQVSSAEHVLRKGFQRGMIRCFVLWNATGNRTAKGGHELVTEPGSSSLAGSTLLAAPVGHHRHFCIKLVPSPFLSLLEGRLF